MNNSKKCDTSARVFKTLVFLKDKSATMHEIAEYFENTYTPEVFLKYINTLKLLGINILRNKDKYSVINYPPYFELNDNEIEGLKLINKIAFPESITKSNIQEFTYFFEKHLTDNARNKLYKNKVITEKLKISPKYNSLLKELENHIKNHYELKVFTDDNTGFVGYPIELYNENNKILFALFSEEKGLREDIDITKIKNIEILNRQKNEEELQKSIKTTITFLLKDRLARSYKLKDGERIIDKKDDGSIVVTNNHEPENILIKRLLRYEDLCELLSPIQTKMAIKKMLDNMIKLYDIE